MSYLRVSFEWIERAHVLQNLLRIDRTQALGGIVGVLDACAVLGRDAIDAEWLGNLFGLADRGEEIGRALEAFRLTERLPDGRYRIAHATDLVGGKTIARRAEPAAACVYFLRRGWDGPIKIGFTKRIARRISTLSTSHDEPLQLLLTLPGNESLEAQLHLKFAHLRIRGEWFQPGPDLLAFIDKKGAD